MLCLNGIHSMARIPQIVNREENLTLIIKLEKKILYLARQFPT